MALGHFSSASSQRYPQTLGRWCRRRHSRKRYCESWSGSRRRLHVGAASGVSHLCAMSCGRDEGVWTGVAALGDRAYLPASQRALRAWTLCLPEAQAAARGASVIRCWHAPSAAHVHTAMRTSPAVFCSSHQSPEGPCVLDVVQVLGCGATVVDLLSLFGDETLGEEFLSPLGRVRLSSLFLFFFCLW